VDGNVTANNTRFGSRGEVKGGLKGVTCVCVFGDGGRWEEDESR